MTLAPVDDSNLGLVIYRSDDTAVAVTRVDDGAAGEIETTLFTPEVGVNYLLRVYEVAGNTAAYEITIGP